MELFTAKFLQKQFEWLLARKSSKTKILQEGGERALGHSEGDITRINFAIKRIEDGQYGICVDCGGGIGMKRLNIIPETPFCTFCAGHIEQKQKMQPCTRY